MYNNTRSRFRVNNIYSDEFGVKVGVHQGSVLSPLLFVIVLEALSREFRTGTPWELLYADDLVISAETEEGSQNEAGINGKLNMGKTKIMVMSQPSDGSGVIGSLKSNPDYHCSRCKGTARPIDGRPLNE